MQDIKTPKTNRFQISILAGALAAIFLNSASLAESLSADHKETSEKSVDALLSLSFEDLIKIEVVSIGFFAMERKRSPGNSYVLSLDQIENSPARSLSDLIDMNVVGMDVGEHRFNSTLIGSRGVTVDNNAKTLVMMDLWQLNQRQHMGYMLPAKNPLMGDIQSIEVIMGPGAIVHGSGAMNGFINMISKTGSSHEGTEVNFEYGDIEQYASAEVSYGKKWSEQKDFYIYVGVQNTQGFTPDNQYNQTAYPGYEYNDLQTKKTYDKNYKISSNFKNHSFSLKALHVMFNEETSHWIYADSSWPISPRKFAFFGISPKYIQEIDEHNSIEYIGAIEYSDFGGRNRKDPENPFPFGTKENHFEGKVIFKNKYETSKLAIGVLWGKRKFENGKTYFIDNPTLPFPNDDGVTGSWEEGALFLEDTLTIGEKTTLSLGLRYDYVSYGTATTSDNLASDLDSESHTTPRAAVAYDITNDSTIKFSYQEGFRYPDMAYYSWWIFHNETLKSGGHELPTLTPETMKSYELGYFSKINNNLTLTANAYHSVYKNQLGWVNFDRENPYISPAAYDYATSVNGWLGSFMNQENEISTIGGELIVNWSFEDDHDLNMGVSKVKMKDFQEKRYPPLQVKATLTSKYLDNRLSIVFNHHYNFGLSKGDHSNMHSDYKEARSVFNASAKYSFSDSFNAKLSIINIFENDTPKYTFDLSSPWLTASGNNHRYIYLNANYKI